VRIPLDPSCRDEDRAAADAVLDAEGIRSGAFTLPLVEVADA
jgi:hypothetical protein